MCRNLENKLYSKQKSPQMWAFFTPYKLQKHQIRYIIFL